ncbi:guanine nucleotide-binding protein-like 1 [Neocloeon triangulifer]|uniref:guanine nucleotide-binding protein-like 1 n=1 Tax=Neocloeon triangulifer TaxID=2078957 RepID=UPI00286F9811|nr:guanine nucleotide-binding protein-like 1 [Neocloeon triangulifer]
MPQGGRKAPFSGKAKKQQIQVKKSRKRNELERSASSGRSMRYGRGMHESEDGESDGSGVKVQKLNLQPGRGRNTNRYVLQFQQESKEEIEARKELARKELKPVPEKDLEVDRDCPFPPELDFPKRPPWDSSMTPEVLDAKEQKYFREYVDNVGKKFSWSELSYFEMNLETWRQLWRVLEMSDIVLFIVDIRFPVYLFPPSLYDFVTNSMKKDMILVLNKIDLAPAPLVLAWKNYFKTLYPSLQVLIFTAFPGYNLRDSNEKEGGLLIRRRRGKMRMAAEGAEQLLQACENIVSGQVDLSSWHKKVAEELNTEYDDDHLIIGQTHETEQIDTTYHDHQRFKDGVLTIGCVGQPNVGKSSLMNAIMGKKVVSVSRTPGHTKHFQTIFLTPTVRLCDCPGLVFPSKVPKPLQVLMGSFPIAQLREPFSSVQFLAERLDLVKLLKIQHPENDDSWSAFDVCDGWAKQRGFLTAKAARLDSYRAANHILRMALDGKVCLCLYPPNFSSEKETWLSHPEIEDIKRIQAKSSAGGASAVEEEIFSSDDDESVSRGQDSQSQDAGSESSGSEDGAKNKFAYLPEDECA